jgi:hypothetical protein
MLADYWILGNTRTNMIIYQEISTASLGSHSIISLQQISIASIIMYLPLCIITSLPPKMANTILLASSTSITTKHSTSKHLIYHHNKYVTVVNDGYPHSFQDSSYCFRNEAFSFSSRSLAVYILIGTSLSQLQGKYRPL